MAGPRGKALLAAALGALLTGAPTALAQPANDDCANATVIPFVPFTDVVDVTGATSEPGDPQDFDCETGSGGVSTAAATNTPMMT